MVAPPAITKGRTVKVVSLSCLNGITGCQPGAKPQVKVIAELFAAARQRHQDLEVGLWFCLRALNLSGSGILRLDATLQALQDYGYSPQTVRRILRKGDGAYWRLDRTRGTRIILTGLKRLAVDHYPGVRMSTKVAIQPQEYRGVHQRRAIGYQAWLVHREDLPTSRQAITQATGVSRRSQQRYDRTTKTGKRPNYAFAYDQDGQLQPMTHGVEGKSQMYYQIRRLPNTYVTHMHRLPRGMIRKVNARASEVFERADATRKRRYFESGKAAARCRTRDPEPFTRVTPNPMKWGTAWALV